MWSNGTPTSAAPSSPPPTHAFTLHARNAVEMLMTSSPPILEAQGSGLVPDSFDSCFAEYASHTIPVGDLYCNWTWDSILCWPPTKAGDTARQRCPRDKGGVDPSKFTTKRCSVDGRWEGKEAGDYSSPQGWTNYTPCYTPEMLQVIRELYAGSDGEAQTKLNIAERTRVLEIVGLSVSLTAMILSLAIFCHFRTLRNNRTKIHKNLFVAMVIQVVIRLTLYIDQALTRNSKELFSRANHSRQGIDNTAILCEASYVLLEYARTAMFMWMFIEGLYLHNMITVTVFQEKFHYWAYTLMGWGVPIVMTTAWAVTTALYFETTNTKCWWGYSFTHYFWILEGPRLGVIVLNMLFLLNIIRVLVVKLRQSHTSETEKVRKAVRAAVVLLPLLGITNVLNMVDAPLQRSAWQFALWSYGTHFLTSFQGFFIAFIYCFLNGEVRAAVMKSVYVYLSLRRDNLPRRNSAFSSVFVGADAVSVERTRAASTTPAAAAELKPRAWRKCWLKMAPEECKSIPVPIEPDKTSSPETCV
ncbi:PDF receptor [Neocloeon triangulifer]|uniref:PDF receptor n=1 Tax=Neocloeon triangulifer TaxID=2078957 RepID=UPI00286FA69D|nr:PDF receptor [Neocloeon triangulifer]